MPATKNDEHRNKMEFDRILEIILHHMQEQVYVCDADKQILYVNPASESLTGWSGEEASTMV